MPTRQEILSPGPSGRPSCGKAIPSRSKEPRFPFPDATELQLQSARINCNAVSTRNTTERWKGFNLVVTQLHLEKCHLTSSLSNCQQRSSGSGDLLR